MKTFISSKYIFRFIFNYLLSYKKSVLILAPHQNVEQRVLEYINFSIKKYVVNFILALFTISYCFSYHTLSCVIHVHSNYSEGKKKSMNEILSECKKYNIDSIVFTDHDIMKVEYGIKPLHKIIKKTVAKTSVLQKGPEKYLQEIDLMNKKYNEIITIPGVESTPYYFWEINEEGLILNNWHKHLLIIGLNKSEQFYKLPLVGNEQNSGEYNLFSLWSFVLLILVFLIKNKSLKIFIVIVIIMILLINYPFRYLPFDQYKNYFELPYQNLINYVNSINSANSINALTIWAHPEATNYQTPKLIGKIRKLNIYLKTEPYYNSLLLTENYDGFAIFAEGYTKVGNIGGIWDKILTEYCNGSRKRPVWCFSEIDFGETKDAINSRKNILLVNEKSKTEILNTLKKGRFYTLWNDGKRELILEDFNFVTSSKTIYFGEEIVSTGDVTINGTIKFSDNTEGLIKIYIISNGKLLKLLEGQTPYKINFSDTPLFENTKKVYYRLFIESNYPNMIATNPVFVIKK